MSLKRSLLGLLVLNLAIHSGLAFADIIEGQCDLGVLFGDGGSSVSGTFQLDTTDKRFVLVAGRNSLSFQLLDVSTGTDAILLGVSPSFDVAEETNPGVYTALLDRSSGTLAVTFTALGQTLETEFVGLAGKCFRNLL